MFPSCYFFYVSYPFLQFFIFLSLFQIFFMICLSGLFHGLILLPVVLAILGPVEAEDKKVSISIFNSIWNDICSTVAVLFAFLILSSWSNLSHTGHCVPWPKNWFCHPKPVSAFPILEFKVVFIFFFGYLEPQQNRVSWYRTNTLDATFPFHCNTCPFNEP